jgi:tRNA A-37 threonylcarbamoyl transferase component Bud32
MSGENPSSSSAQRASVATGAEAGDSPRSAEIPSAARLDPYVGKTIDGRYLIERVIGEGGMGVVYAGRHKVIDKRVAIKVLRGEMASDQDLNERFLQEARAASAIGNPHIIDISDFGQLADGCTYFVMEMLDGKSLSEIVAEANGPLPVPRIYSICKQIAQGLAAAHAANIIHRDLKPDNVMIISRGSEKNFVKVLDFGIAKVGGGATKVTRAGSVFGTPHYMSPEQAAGAIVDHRTDIYALGVILYELASGKVPFDADNFMGILTQHMYKAPVPIRALVPEVDVPAGLDAVVLKCLTKKPEGRYATMDDLVVDIEKLESGVLPGAVHEMMARSGGFNVPADYFRQSGMPAPVPASPFAPKKRWPLYLLMAAVATLVGVAGVVVVGRSSSGKADTLPVVPVAPVATTGTPAVTGPTPSSAIAAPPAPVELTREILVSVTPTDATIARDGRELGQPPLALHLSEGETATLVLSRKGYKPKTVTVDGSEPKQSFALEAVAPSWKPTAVKPATGSTPMGGIDDVGDPFTKKH